jgi:NADH-quinone oxidoreductase subunit G
MCSRCVRFTREIAGTSELMVINRGAHEEIDVFPGYPLANKLSGNVVDLCPVGALGDKDFLYEQRVWFMRGHDGVCAGCSTGCSIRIEENQDTVYRLKPRENPHINQWWMCDEGRYGYKHVHAPNRLTEPRRRDQAGALVNAEWAHLPGELIGGLSRGGRLAAVLSPHLTVEEAYLLATLIRQHDPDALLALGPVPVVGTDEKFKNGFTIRAEKAPNRKGVEAIVSRLMGRIPTLEDVLQAADRGELRGAWITSGYKTDWIDGATADRLAGLELLVVQDSFPSPLWELATHQLPAATFAERSGSYVNFADRLQSFKWAIRPPAGVMVEGPLYWQLLGRPGMYNPQAVLNEVAAAIGYFSAAAGEAIPPVGIDLKVNQLAAAH